MINIRKYSNKDFSEVFKIIKQEYGKEPYNEKWTRNNALKTLNHYSKVGKIYVAEIGKKVVGFLVLHKEFYNTGAQLDLKEIAVNSRFQGQGVGKALIKKAEEFAIKNKIKQIYLTTHLDAPAYLFYVKHGFIPAKKTVFFRKELK
ncbi:GNAT family N-acetyltransferase [Candidatus Pacearchaeota archaeon]|nr:GNAT family N-acetyltransferase [Candidatus Pacearchaeota archaeon]